MVEERIYKSENTELRAYTEDDKRIIAGYAAKYNVASRLLAEGGKLFNEILLPNAFRDVIKDDVYMTFNHDRDKVFARTVNNTLTLEDDEIGLRFKAVLNDTTGAIDLYKMIERGDVFENSFAFTVDKEGQEWSRSSNGDNVRKISRVSKLFDVSVVTHAAYPETEVSVVRGLDEYFEEQKPETINLDREQNELDLIKLNLK
jgi:hypothetical protein